VVKGSRYRTRFLEKRVFFLSLQHNHIRKFTCNLLSEVCKDVAVEPVLHDLSGEDLPSPSSSVSDEARVDVKHEASGKQTK